MIDIDWSDILRYSREIIPVIRGNVPRSVILVGTPDYDRILSDAVLRPLEYDDVMYVLHFYAASHREGLMEELDTAVRAGLPVFISECSFCEASGDGDIDFSSAVKWFEYLNAHQLSYAIWNLSDKAETSAFFVPGFEPSKGIEDRDLTATGRWARDLIRGTAPDGIPIPDGPAESKAIRRIHYWITNSLGDRGYAAVSGWTALAGVAALILLAFALTGVIYLGKTRSVRKTYDIACGEQAPAGKGEEKAGAFGKIALFVSAWCTVIYLGWRIRYSIPADAGFLPVICNLLLVVEVYLDGEEKPCIGAHVDVTIRSSDYTVSLKGVVTGTRQSRNRTTSTQTIEILDDCGNRYEYLSVLYDRVPTLPQALKGEVGIVTYLWKNIAQRLARVGQV